MSEVFISYAWGGESEAIADSLEQTFQEKGIKLIRDKTDLGYKDLIREFMQQIGRGKCVIAIISDKYLKSKNCMFELLEISKHGNFYDRIFPIVLKDARIYNAIERLNYIKYWEDKIKELDKEMRGVSLAYLQGFREDIDLYTEIRNKIAGLVDTLQNMNNLTSEMHRKADFTEVLGAIEKRLSEDAANQNNDSIRPQSVKQIEECQQEIEKLVGMGSNTSSSDITGCSVDDLVQQVRLRFHNDIQRLHSMIPLWEVNYEVPLSNLFVDIDILEELRSSLRADPDDLWQDFIIRKQERSSRYGSLDRVGLSKERRRVSGMEVLEKNRNLMVVGKPGSGKTTYLRRIVMECNAGNLQTYRIPFLIKLREFVEDGREIDYSLKRYLEQYWQLSNTETQLVLSRGRVLLLLDGLDEVTGEDEKNIAKEIKRFARQYPHVQTIVTCRTQSQESRFEGFDYIEVADFNELQVRLFAEHWFKTVMEDEIAGQARAQEFLRLLFLEANESIRELTSTPMLLSLTCEVFHKTKKLYSKRSKLYEEALELLLKQWDKWRAIERDEIYRDLSVERKQKLLSNLALKKFEQPQYVMFEQKEIEDYIAEFLGIEQQDSVTVLRAIETQHGLLFERNKKVWSFSHLTLQEYLVAQHICTSKTLEQALEKLTTHIYEKQWRQIFLLAIEMLKNVDNLVKLMKFKLDKLLADNEKLQKFLTKINQKALQIKMPDDYDDNSSRLRASIRAFYCANTLEHALRLNHPVNSTSDCASALVDAIDPKFSLNIVFNTALGLEHKSILDYNLVLDRALTGILTLALDLSNKLYFDSSFTHADILSLTLTSCLHDFLANEFLSHNLNPKLKQSLKAFKQELSDSGRGGFNKWWQTKGFDWTKKLRTMLIKYRSIGYDWQFNTDEIQKLRLYLEGHKLLVECLDNASYITPCVKQDIETNLLLPVNIIPLQQISRKF